MWKEWILIPYGIRMLKCVDIGSMWRAGTRLTAVRLDGWCEGGLGQQSTDGGGSATMLER